MKLNPDQWPIGLCWRLQRLWLARSQQSRTSDCWANAKKPELAAFIGSIVGRKIHRISGSPPFVNNWNSQKQIHCFVYLWLLLYFVKLCFASFCESQYCVVFWKWLLCSAKACCVLQKIVVLWKRLLCFRENTVLLEFCKQEPTQREVNVNFKCVLA